MQARIKLLSYLFLLFFFIVLLRLFYWQILSHGKLQTLAENQYSSSRVIHAQRGEIVSSDNFPLVLNRGSLLLYLDPKQIKIPLGDLQTKLKSVVPDLTIDERLASNKDLSWLPLKKDIENQKAEEIKKMKIEGVGFEESDKRAYPEASMAAQLLGFVGEDDNGSKKGYFGLEGYYDSELKGKDGLYSFEQDALGRPIPLAREIEEKSVPGRDLITNLDRTLQYLVENRLRDGLQKYQAISGTVTIMNPKNGAILAMASFPNYDPNSFYSYGEDLYRNPVISSSFEPGSIFKVLVMVSALDSKAVSVNDICSICFGPKQISGYSIKTWNEKYYPSSSMIDIIVHSDNVGMVYVAEKMGSQKLYDYLKKFGFGEKTGIDLQGEAVPGLKKITDWREIDLATASFGQGIAVTPIQMINAVSVIANGGAIFEPQIAKSLKEGEKIIPKSPVEKGRVISTETAKAMTEMMVQAVDRGEAKWAKPKGYNIAGKTGTAQIPIAGHYDPDKTIASFVGFAPADDPKFIMLVTLNEPQKSPWGSETAAPLWFDIAKDIFRLWDIKPKN